MGRIQVGKFSVRLQGLIGGAKSHLGRIIGVGSRTGQIDRQYFRMDYGKHGHSGTNGPDHWSDGRFHFHVRR